MENEKIRNLGLQLAGLSRQRRLKNRNYSIICNNCCGTLINHLLLQEKRSPTENLTIELREFPTFCRHLKAYLRLPMEEPTEEERGCYPETDRPLGILRGGPTLPDIHLVFWHYDSFPQARDAWYRRRTRVNYENLFFLMDCSMDANEALLEEFRQIPSPNKMAFTHLPGKDTYRFFYYTEKRYKTAYMFVQEWRGPFLHRIMDRFPYIRWLNHGAKGDFLPPD